MTGHRCEIATGIGFDITSSGSGLVNCMAVKDSS